MMKTLYILLLVATLFSCETILNEIPESSLPRTQEKLVLACFISPQDSVVTARITVSTPLFGIYKTTNQNYYISGKDTVYFTESSIVKDAKVTLNVDNQLVTLKFDNKNEWYQISQKEMKIIAGKTYTLKAQSKDKTIEAACTVPTDLVKIDSYKVDSTIETDFGRTRKGYTFSMKWQDVKAKANFYRVRADLDYEVITGTTLSTVYARTQWDNETNSLNAYFSDENSDGGQFASPEGKALMGSGGGGGGGGPNGGNNTKITSKRPNLTLELMNIDPNYAEYHKSIIRQETASNNPFAEASPIFSNVKNGLGCFGASNRTILKLKL